MKIQIDANHLLTITNPNIPQTKEYTYAVGWYTFSDYDKWMIILHKKDFKIINLKNLGDGMSVIYSKEDTAYEANFNLSAFEDALRTFQWFDEITGQKYFFIPNLWEKDIQAKNEILKKLSKCELKKTEKGVMVELQHETQEMTKNTEQTDTILSYLFGLVIMYGKLDAKKGELSSIKIQLPLFWQYLNQQEMLDKIVQQLQQEGLFVKADKLANNNGITYQISSNDYELLEILTKWYEPIEKFEQITKSVFTQEMKARLIEFLETNTEIPSEWKAEVMKQIKSGTIKFLMK